MKTINKPIQSVFSLMPPAADPRSDLRLTTLCLEEKVEGGYLLYHTLTNELLYLEDGEQPRDYLREHHFLVTRDFDESGVSDKVRAMLRFYQKASADGYKTYTILPTTDCNARCFYCFELGGKPQTMNEETAEKVIGFIRDTASKSRKIKLRFFGGEPLLEQQTIDRIISALTDAGYEISSFLITNAYLFTSELIRKAKSRWNLREVQITLDGTEDVYNRRKAYLHDKNGAYKRVLQNIEDLLTAGIKVYIRLNMDRMNYPDLMNLSGELKHRFGHFPDFHVYAHLLFQEILSDNRERQAEVYGLFRDFNAHLKELGLLKPSHLPKSLKINYCMADDPQSVVILPDGRLHACEHYTENHCFGSVNGIIAKAGDLPYWEAQFERDPECGNCPLYATCFRSKHCPDIPEHCIPQEKEQTIQKLREAMRREYESPRSLF